MTSKDKHIKPITVNGRFLSRPVTGVQRYAHELLRSLDSLLSTGELEPVPITVIVPPNTNANLLPSYSFIRIKQVGRLQGQLWEQFELPRFTRNSMLFTPCGGAPVTHKHHVITIHDAGPFSTPQAYSPLYRNYYKALQTYLVRRALHVITVSEFSKQELLKFFRIPDNYVSVTYLSGEHILRYKADESVLARHALQKTKYILGVSSRNPNKNFPGLVRASASFASSNVQIAIAGSTNADIFGESSLTMSAVKELGFVNDAQLRSLYENAACFVFPSFYEGFGLPPLEALTLGCPVIVSSVASLPEIFGETATYCDPYSPDDIASQISKVLRNQHPSQDVAMRHASSFTWERCARETWSVLMMAMKNNS